MFASLRAKKDLKGKKKDSQQKRIRETKKYLVIDEWREFG